MKSGSDFQDSTVVKVNSARGEEKEREKGGIEEMRAWTQNDNQNDSPHFYVEVSYLGIREPACSEFHFLPLFERCTRTRAVLMSQTVCMEPKRPSALSD